ncbi:MAG: 3-mercaptopyruvate sulfurtransferase [Sphingomicrobium sp.]
MPRFHRAQLAAAASHAYPWRMDSLVSAQWLAAHLGEPDLVTVDASWHMPASGRGGHSEYLDKHIPGARFFDIDELSDAADPAPHMLPTAAQFGGAMEKLGISRSDRIVVYDNSPVRSATRAWFTLRHFGADKVAVLDGGLAAWLAAGKAVESGEPPPRPAQFEAVERNDVVAKARLLAGDVPAVLDARGRRRFEGAEAEPRPGVAPGRIPGSLNLPFAKLYADNGRLKSTDELGRLFADAGIDPSEPFVATCGSGITAASLLFAAHLLGGDKSLLYDGSWAQWGADPATPKAVGPA